jgi:hypothetical protein
LTVRRQLATEFPARTEFRKELANSYNSLGGVLHSMHHLEEAEFNYDYALHIRQELATVFPDQPDIRNDLAGTLMNLSRLCILRHDFTQAKMNL